MFYAIYEFEVSEKNTQEFIKIWRQLTLEIKNNSGGLGSRLHKNLNKPNCWIAYAKWPNKQTWENRSLSVNPTQKELRKKMSTLYNSMTTVFQLEETENLLTN